MRSPIGLPGLLPVLVAFAVGCGGEGLRESPPAIEVRLVPELELGRDPSAAPEYLLGRPRFVRTDSHGKIYVGDAGPMVVRVYDRTGTLVRSIGGRGREPGRFLDITCTHVDRQDRLIVADGLDKFITRFSPEGEVEERFPIDPEQLLWPRALDALASGQYLFLYKMSEPVSYDGTDADQLFHVFGESFEKQLDFGAWRELVTRPEIPLDNLFQVRPGNFWVRRDQTVLYAPAAYRGRIHLFAERDGQWQSTAELTGYVARREPVSLVDPTAYEQGELDLVMTESRGRWGVIFHNESRGIFELHDGRIVHFTLIESDGQRVFGVEVYTPQGELVGYAAIDAVALKAKGATFLSRHVLWKDEEDRFYLQGNFQVPVVQVVRLQLEEA